MAVVLGLLWLSFSANQAAAALTTFKTDDFSGSGVCAFCHSRLSDGADNDVSNDAHWRSTMMANAAKDPLWQAKISAEVELVSDLYLKQKTQEKCSRCHMGMARYQQLAEGAGEADIYVFGTGFLDPAHYLHGAAMDGVSCTLCHQITAENLGMDSSFTGQYVIDTASSVPDRKRFLRGGSEKNEYEFGRPIHGILQSGRKCSRGGSQHIGCHPVTQRRLLRTSDATLVWDSCRLSSYRVAYGLGK